MLVAEGLDTVASVSINGQLVGTSEDMFHRHRWDVPLTLLNGSGNTLEVKFSNAPAYAKAKAAAHPYAIPC